ncbi:HAD-IIIA family hydrolase [Acetatifactor aquisgranensis]|uniref:HAD-IIIA family hydrolase n=1 Tax=Acetatifactor aquisgranensis TaxID=2941233 RepID=UPI002041A7CA|nr:HAD-IIIA family hydrolase [Acetatifactor aquisgranensis]
MKVVIMAGGKGTRIARVNSEVPKPMIPIEGKPILEHQINTLKRQGYTELILIIGHMGNVIRDHFGDGSKYGVHIQYITEESPLGTAGALFFLKEQLKEDFLLINGDILFDVDIRRFRDYHRKQNSIATILTHPNDHPYDSGIIVANQDGKVIDWLHKEDSRLWYKNRVNAGLHMLSPEVFSLFPDLQKRDLDRDVLKPLIGRGQLSIYDSPEYVKDMGTPERYCSVTKDFREGKVAAKNLGKKQKAIFLDRDGTINEYVGFLKDIEDFRLIDGTADAIRMINGSDFLAIVVTNQPVIARGEVTLEELQEIHNKMETLLGQKGAYLDAVYYCPHHPDKGFEGERAEYKLECGCRKPKPGMLLAAAEEYNIDLSRSWIIGDGEADVRAGQAAGCHAAMIGNRNIQNDDVAYFENLRKAVEVILKGNSI